MTITADANVLIRVVVRDDKAQAAQAEKVLQQATVIAIPLSALCEVVWVLRRVYGLRVPDLCAAIEALTEVKNVVVDRPAVEAGLSALRGGADFADGVIAFEGRRMGGEVFVSFDRKAVALVREQGHAAVLCGEAD